MNDKLVANIVLYAKKIAEHNLSGDKTNNISVKADEATMYITKSGVKLEEMTAENVIEVKFTEIDKCPTHTLKDALLHKQVYENRDDVACIMITSPTASYTVASMGCTIPPVLDDMAQIVGPTAKTARTNDSFAILAALKGRSSCLLNGIGALSTGRTLDETFTAVLVLDKAAHTYIMASAVGGCKPVSKLGAILEHYVYQKKYSKANQDAILESERK
jgi:Ribulose-5-phosphate 4-epimerase and related epimerases and aldolases